MCSSVIFGLTKLYSSLQTESDVNASISLKASAVLFKAGTSFLTISFISQK